jgi:serine/threonine protein kinase
MTLQALLGDRREKGIRSMLGARFELARKLVRAVCLLHSSGWLHKNIRAESVMFFPEHVSSLQEDRYEINTEIDVSNPILMGYIFSRPDDIVKANPPSAQKIKSHESHEESLSEDEQYGPISYSTIRRTKPHYRSSHTTVFNRTKTPRTGSIYGHNASERIGEPRESEQANISGFKLDYYQHPAKHANPERLYRHAYDVYSLGILLLEIGLWKRLRVREDNADDKNGEDHYERRRWICREYLQDLRWACGDTYADVVLNCLMIDCSDDEAGMVSERELCAKVVADLEGCRA